MVTQLGEAALAATTTGGLNAFAAFIFPLGIAFVIASFSAQLTGRSDVVGARRFGWYGLALAVLAQGVMLCALPGLPWLLAAFSYTPEVERLMYTYLSIRLLSTGAAVGIEALGNYYAGRGNTGLQMRVNLSAMLLNVFFNYLLIEGRFGLPALGVAGAAWASVAATTVAFIGFVCVFLRDGRAFPRPILHLGEFARLLRFGVPSGLNWSFEFFAFIAFINIVVAGLGTVSLAAMMAVMQVNSFSFMPAFGLASAGAILVGQAIGRGDRASVPSIVRLTFGATSVWMGVSGVVYVCAPHWLLAPFVPAGAFEQRFLSLGAQMLMFSALWQLVDAAGITLSEALRAAGDTAFTMWTRGVLAWALFLPGSWLTVRYFNGAELSAVTWLLLYLGLLALVLWLRFRSGAWRRIELLEPVPLA